MYVGDFEDKKEMQKNDKIERFFEREDDLSKKKDLEKSINIEDEENLMRVDFGEILHQWQASEFEVQEQNTDLLYYILFFLIVIVGYAVYSNSPIMAITFILLGVVGYINMGKKPRIIDFKLTDEGVAAGREFFTYENIKSFWIFYEPDNLKVISLHTDSYITPFVHIPLHNEDPVGMREILLKYLPEVKQKYSMVDKLERILGI